MRKILSVLGLLLIGSSLWIGGTVGAQTQTYTGYMGSDVPDDLYPIRLEAGQVIRILAEADNSNLDPFLRLQDPGGDAVAENDNLDASTHNSYIRYIAEVSGEYTVVMSNRPNTNGNYRLTIDVAPPITGPGVYTGFMSDYVPNDRYPIYLEAGQVVQITAEADNSNLDPYLYLENPNGDNVTANDDRDSTTLNSFVRYVAETSGQYEVIMSNYRGSSGNYRLTIEVLTGGVAYIGGGGVFTGYMGDDVPDDRYTVQLQAGQVISITAEADNSELDPYLQFLGPTGNTLAQNDDRDNTTLSSYIQHAVKADGTYTVVMSNYPNTSGNYRLTIEITGEGTLVDTGGAGGGPEVVTTGTSEEYTGYMGNDVPDDTYPVQLEAGQGLIATAEMTGGDLDTVLLLEDQNGNEVARNDDRDDSTLNSELVYIAQEAGTYTVIMTNFPNTAGDYRLTISVVLGSEVVIPSRVAMSGEILYYDTPHFRIHYTNTGADRAAAAYVQQVAQTMEEVYNIEIGQFGWPIPPNDGSTGGNALYDVYLVNLLGDQSGALGYASPEWPAMDNPNTTIIEEMAVPSYLVLDNDYAEVDEDPIALMRATAAHEYHHSIQFGHDQGDPFGWYYEATASWMETVTVPDQEAATGYVEAVFTYPEICFGVEGSADPTDGTIMYGSWLFMESLTKAHGDQAALQLWQNIALSDGWQPLEDTLAPYNDTVPLALARYHAQNLVRDYTLADEFPRTVWLENAINDIGDWTYTGRGVQELAANYYELALSPGQYTVAVQSEDDALELWLIGITGIEAEVISLGSDGIIDTTGYEYVYLMVFNPKYDEDVTNCHYSDYKITVAVGSGTMPAVVFKFDATHFEPPALE